MGIVAEEWRPLPGKWAGLKYEVSNLGRVRSLHKNWRGRVCKSGSNAKGYAVVWLYLGKKRYTKSAVHRLVATAFVSGFREGLQVNHINGIKTDNRAENLEWVTPRENTQHAIDTGLMKPMLNQACKDYTRSLRKLNDDQAAKIRKRRLGGRLYAEIAEEFGVHATTIGLICRGVHYRAP